jgi:hypothetical protein
VQIDTGGLEDEVECPLHQRRDRRRRPLCGEAADHDRPRSEASLLQGTEHLDAVPLAERVRVGEVVRPPLPLADKHLDAVGDTLPLPLADKQLDAVSETLPLPLADKHLEAVLLKLRERFQPTKG